MKWIELKDVEVGSGTIFLFGCHPTQSPYKVKAWLQEQKPNAVVLYAGQASKVREYQAAHWVISYGHKEYHNYLTEGYRQEFFHSALQSMESALQRFAQKYKFHPSEIVLVRAKKFTNT